MKIILGTYNYYPTYSGGTEVYTKAFATYLVQKGFEVLIICGTGKEDDRIGEVIFSDLFIEVDSYKYDNCSVWGINLNSQGIREIYSNENPEWERSFNSLLRTQGWDQADAFILNGFSTTIGLSLLNAILRNNPAALTSVIVHTPFICAKGDMIHSETKHRCNVLMTPAICSACLLNARIKAPYFVGELIVLLQRKLKLENLISGFSFGLYQLLQLKFNSLKKLDNKVNTWLVFSEDMKQFLEKQLFVSKKKIAQVKHGIDKSIFFPGNTEYLNGPFKFLYAGRFETIKGVDLLCDAWSKLEDDPKTRILYLAGNWKDTELGKAIEQRLSMRRDIVFISGMTQVELAALYREIHCVIVPSKWIETGPLVVHEAIFSGCDIISSDIGGQGELALFYKNKAKVFRSGDADSLLREIVHYRPSAAKEAADKTLSLAEHFDRACEYLLENNKAVVSQ